MGPAPGDAAEAELAARFELREEPFAHGDFRVRMLLPRAADALIDEAEFEADERLPYWADLWPSAQILAGEVRTMRLAGQRVLELGCGMGLVAVAAALAGGDVTATDYYEDAILFAKLNVAEATGTTIATRMVDWTNMPTDLGKFDVVLASDVLYEPRYAALVAGAIASTLARGGEAIVADPGRIALPSFREECTALGLTTEGDPRPYAEGEIRQTVTLWKVRWATN
jgi:ETFB lysine methyltransferase